MTPPAETGLVRQGDATAMPGIPHSERSANPKGSMTASETIATGAR